MSFVNNENTCYRFSWFYWNARLCKSSKKDFQVVGIDNLNDYYDQQLKIDRNNEILSLGKRFKFIKCDLLDKDQLTNVFNNEKFDVVINLAAQAGVRYSILNPQAYIDSNIQGFY